MKRLKFAVGLMSLTIVAMLGGLLLAGTALPLIAGWERVVLTSGSMEPLISPGDVVLATHATHPVAAGTVVIFKNPNKPGSLVTHRVVESLPDGSYRTKGDANPQPDVSLVTRENVVGRGVLLVPGIGMPALWGRQGHPALVGAAAVVMLLLLWLSRYGLLAKYDPWLAPQVRTGPSRDLKREKSIKPLSVVTKAEGVLSYGVWLISVVGLLSVWAVQRDSLRLVAIAAGTVMILLLVLYGVQARYDPWGATVPREVGKRPWDGGAEIGISALRALVASLLIITVAAGVIAPRFSAASFTAHTSNSGNAFKVSCASRVVTAAADTYVDQNTTTTAGSSTELHVMSHAKDQRTLLRFPTSAIPSGCTIVAAKLRLYATSSVAGRTIEAAQVTGSWSEASTTWDNQPATTGSVVTSSSGLGWREWTVTEQTLAMASSGSVNLRLRDSVEEVGTSQRQVYSSREGANAPQLVLTLN